MSKRILIIEDDIALTKELVESLTSVGFKVLTTSDSILGIKEAHRVKKPHMLTHLTKVSLGASLNFPSIT